jgi:hypothetical protein
MNDFERLYLVLVMGTPGDPLHTTGSSPLTVHEWRVRRFAPEG